MVEQAFGTKTIATTGGQQPGCSAVQQQNPQHQPSGSRPTEARHSAITAARISSQLRQPVARRRVRCPLPAGPSAQAVRIPTTHRARRPPPCKVLLPALDSSPPMTHANAPRSATTTSKAHKPMLSSVACWLRCWRKLAHGLAGQGYTGDQAQGRAEECAKADGAAATAASNGPRQTRWPSRAIHPAAPHSVNAACWAMHSTPPPLTNHFAQRPSKGWKLVEVAGYGKTEAGRQPPAPSAGQWRQTKVHERTAQRWADDTLIPCFP